MSIPNVSMSFLQGGLGIVSPGPGGAQAKIGPALLGFTQTTVAPQVLSVGPGQAANILGGGPLADATSQVTDTAGTPIYAVPLAATGGTVTATFAQTGSGAGVVTATAAPHVTVLCKCSTPGSLGTAAFQFSVNGAAYGQPVLSTASAWIYQVPGTFLSLSFAASTYYANNTWGWYADGTAATPGGTTPPTVTPTSSPLDAYNVRVTVTTAGALATAQFVYSLDGGASQSTPIVTAATYAIPGSGIVLAFSSAAYVLGDVYAGYCTAPMCTAADIVLAHAALRASAFQVEGVHVVGFPYATTISATTAGTAFTAANAAMTSAKLVKRYLWAAIECPTLGTPILFSSAQALDTADTDSVIATAFLALSSTEGRVIVGAGDCALLSPLTGLTLRRNCAWVATATAAAEKLSEDMGKVLRGAVLNVQSIYRDEEATPGLYDARFITMRSLYGKAGYFLTGGVTMAQVASDYSTFSNVRVVNRAATIAMAAFTDYLNDDVRIDPKTGYIDDRDARDIDNAVTAKLHAALKGTPGSVTDEVSDVYAKLSRTDNLLSVPTATAVVSIVPKAIMRNISVQIGFINPLLRQS